MGRCSVSHCGWGAFVLAIAALAAAFGSHRWSDRVTSVSDDDPRMNAAMDKARSTVDSFIAALTSPKPGQSEFAVKMAFTDRDKTEVMWIAPVSYDGKMFRGTVSNEPQSVFTVKMGQTVTVEPSGIADWMYSQDGKLVGAYTLRVLRETLSPGERAEFDREVRFIDE
jgi:uncharacterized protein YegJ (DUF2314 family)